jgi:hypothetical protein
MSTKTATPTRMSTKKFAALVTTKNVTVRRAMWPVGMPACLSAQTPSARPPAPPLGSSELAASSTIAAT